MSDGLPLLARNGVNLGVGGLSRGWALGVGTAATCPRGCGRTSWIRLRLLVRLSPSMAVLLLAFCALNTSSKATATETHACFVLAFCRQGLRAVPRHRGRDSRN